MRCASYVLAWCSIILSLLFDMQNDIFQKKMFHLLTLPKGSRVCVKKELKFLTSVYKRNWPRFSTDQICYIYFCIRYPVIISTKKIEF